MPPFNRWLRKTAVFLLIAIAATSSAILLGLFDPRPIGTLQVTLPLVPQTISAQGETAVWLDHPPLPENFSVRLTAVFHSGDPDSGYGLLLGTPENYLAIAVSPLGLVSIWENDLPQPPSTSSGQALLQGGESEGAAQQASPLPGGTEGGLTCPLPPATCHPLLPWQPWPHIVPTHAPNEIWLDVHADQLAVRLNREWLWAGEWTGAKAQLGLVGVAFGETAVVHFRQIGIFWEE